MGSSGKLLHSPGFPSPSSPLSPFSQLFEHARLFPLLLQERVLSSNARTRILWLACLLGMQGHVLVFVEGDGGGTPRGTRERRGDSGSGGRGMQGGACS